MEPLTTQIQKQAIIPPLFAGSSSQKRRVLTDTLTVRMNSDFVEAREAVRGEARLDDVIVGKAVFRAVEWEPKAERFGVVMTQKATAY